ncbi:hypothetical protein B296_00050000 [Ensete ventricosum]|uniref:Uncharacterized protein n=1 Tax=Ensete ventricosum TaxID=4639 RepID=A0A426X4B5_ENSVE|nr:hypothetical protein B296_00050000 [Ensete ventricosum]
MAFCRTLSNKRVWDRRLQMAMESVEAVVAHIQGLSGSQEEVAHLHSLLKQSEDALRSQAARLGAFLHQLDPSVHSLGYLFLL